MSSSSSVSLKPTSCGDSSPSVTRGELADLVHRLRDDKQFVAVEAWILPVRPLADARNGNGESESLGGAHD